MPLVWAQMLGYHLALGVVTAHCPASATARVTIPALAPHPFLLVCSGPWVKGLKPASLKCFHITTPCHLHCSLPSTGKAAKHIWAMVRFENSSNKTFLHCCKHAATWDTNSSHHCSPDLTIVEKNTSKSANHSISTN